MLKLLVITVLSFSLVFPALTTAAQQPLNPSTHKENIAGTERTWRIFIPSPYQNDKKLPLVLNFHGTGGTSERQESLSQFEPLAEKESFIVVAPQAKYLSPEINKLTWNVDQLEGEIDDVAFVKELIKHLKNTYAIDENRIYATGFSGGGRMSSRLACDLSDVIAAFAPVAGVRFPENCRPTRPVPIITFHGTKDGVNHYIHKPSSPPYWRMGVEPALQGWIKNNGCDNAPTEEKISETLSKLSYLNCDTPAELVFYKSTKSGHTWPGTPSAPLLKKFGLGETDMEISATELIWEFFLKHKLKKP